MGTAALFCSWVLQHCTGFARLVWGRLRVHRAFIYSNRFVCSVCFCSLLPRLTLLLSLLDILHCLPRAVGVPLESVLKLVSRISPCGAYDTHYAVLRVTITCSIEIATCISSELAAQIEMPLDPSGRTPIHVYVRYISLTQIHIYRFVSACAHAKLICKCTQIRSNRHVQTWVWLDKN